MKKIYFLLVCLCSLGFMSSYAQVQIDKQIQLVGNGTDAKITGIKDVTGTQDATSVGSLQSGAFTYSPATGTGNNFDLNVSPPIAAYTEGMLFSFKANQTNTGPATLNINNLGAISIKKGVNQNLSGCEIQNGQIVTVVYDGTNFQIISVSSLLGAPPTTAAAGPDQINVPANSTVNLAGNTPANGTGTWSIISGSGGNVANPSNPTSTFTGQIGTSYSLAWTISNTCGTTSDTVDISFTASCYVPGSQTFSYTGAQQTFTVPCDVVSVTIECWGAQGGSAGGGLGGYAKGDLAVSAGQTLYVYVGEQGGGAGTPQTFGGGGSGAFSNRAGGGGASDVRSGGTGIGNRIIVAGGGGGGSTDPCCPGTGGAGGGLVGGNGSDNNAFGGTQSNYGTGSCCPCPAPSQGYGQDGYCGGCNGSGGGGGYYGGGACTQGAGGSGYVGGVTNSSMQTGIRSGYGQVVITW